MKRKIHIKILFIILLLLIGYSNVHAFDEKYTVTFDINNGKDTNVVQVDANALLEKPMDPVKEGYVFAGWYTDINYEYEYDFTTPVTSDMTLYAKWNVNIYTVTFKTIDDETIGTSQVQYNELLVRPEDPVKQGYYFGGWYKDVDYENKFSFLTPIKEDITLYAFWSTFQINSCDVTFVPEMGLDPFIMEVSCGDTIEAPYVELPDGTEYEKIIWYTNEDKTSDYLFNDPITEDITLYARLYSEDGSEIIDTPDTASTVQIGTIAGGILIVLVGAYLIYSKMHTKKGSNL